MLRTGLRAGLYTSAVDERAIWTSDGGRHWSYSPQIGALAAGSGSFLFWWRGRSIYRVTPWPAPYNCTVALGGDRCGYRDRSGRLPEGPLRAAVIPGGVVAASFGPHPRALVARWLRRGAAPRVVRQDLPGLGGRQLFVCDRPIVDWPDIEIAACELGGPNDPVAFWSSSDGGSHWRVVGT